MWDQMKSNYLRNCRSRAEYAVALIGAVAVGVLISALVGVAEGQVHKAQLRDAQREAQRVAALGCVEQNVLQSEVQRCMAQLSLAAAGADTAGIASHGSSYQQAEMDLHVVSFRY